MARRYSLEELRELASQRDVSFNLQRLFGERIREGDPEVLEIMNMGNTAEALNWLRSTTPEGMEAGTATREERIARAAEHAAKAGVALDVLAEEHGLTELL